MWTIVKEIPRRDVSARAVPHGPPVEADVINIGVDAFGPRSTFTTFTVTAGCSTQIHAS